MKPMGEGEKLERLTTLLRVDEKGALVLLRCNSPIERKRLLSELQKRLNGEVHLYPVTITPSWPNLYRLLRGIVDSESFREEAKKHPKVSFSVGGLEFFDAKARREFVSLLNITREGFRDIRHTVLLWVDDETYKRINKAAPDFRHWVSLVIDFPSPPAPTIPAYELLGMEGDAERAREEIPVLERLIADLRSSKRPDEELIKSLGAELGRDFIISGSYAAQQGRWDEAIKWYEKALEIARQINDIAGEAVTWHALASIDLRRGEHEAAREKFERALRIFQRIDDRTGEAATWHNLATIDLERGEYEAAREKFERNLGIWQELGDKSWEAKTWHQLATIDLERGEYEAARKKLKKSLRINQWIGDRAGEAATWHELGRIDLARGEYEAAREKFEKSLRINQRIGDRAGEGATFAQLGILAAETDHPEKGLRLLVLSAIILRSIGHADLKRVEPWVNRLASQLGYTQERLQALAEEVLAEYRKDRGWGMVRGEPSAPS